MGSAHILCTIMTVQYSSCEPVLTKVLNVSTELDTINETEFCTRSGSNRISDRHYDAAASRGLRGYTGDNDGFVTLHLDHRQSDEEDDNYDVGDVTVYDLQDACDASISDPSQSFNVLSDIPLQDLNSKSQKVKDLKEENAPNNHKTQTDTPKKKKELSESKKSCYMYLMLAVNCFLLLATMFMALYLYWHWELDNPFSLHAIYESLIQFTIFVLVVLAFNSFVIIKVIP